MTQLQRRVLFPLLALCVTVVSVLAFNTYAGSINEKKNDLEVSVIANDSSVEKSVANDAAQALVPTSAPVQDLGEGEDLTRVQPSSSESISAQESVSAEIIPTETSISSTNTSTIPSAAEEEKKVSVTLRAVPVGKGAEEYTVNITKGSSVYDVMVAATDKGFAFTSKSFPGIGRYVKSVLGIPEDKRAGFYWVYYINGKYASQGISDTTIASGDVIMWKFEKK